MPEVSSQLFEDRIEAGEVLAASLSAYRDRDDVVVLALPRGGVPVAREVARALSVPLDVFVVRKLGVPGHEELAMGAIATGGVRQLNREVVDALGIPASVIDEVAAREQIELDRTGTRLSRQPPAAIARRTRPSSSSTTGSPRDRRCAPL